jgi:hypothetical protein
MRTKELNDPFEPPSLEQIEQMERQRLQAIESLQICDHCVKCQRCGMTVPIVGKLSRPMMPGSSFLPISIAASISFV